MVSLSERLKTLRKAKDMTQEGVEFEDQVALLKKPGCQVIQGYHYSKPLSLTDYIGFLTNGK